MLAPVQSIKEQNVIGPDVWSWF